MRPTLIPFFCFLLIINLAACGPLPKPFKKNKNDSDLGLIEPGAQNDIAVEIVGGRNAEEIEGLGRAVAREIINHKLIAYYNDRGSSQFILSGYIRGWRGEFTSAPPFVINWVFKDRKDKVLETYESKVFGTLNSWQNNPHPIISKIAKDVARNVNGTIKSMFQKNHFEKQVTKKIWVQSVTHTSGRTDFPLVQAINYALKRLGIDVVKNKSAADEVLIGEVRLEPVGLTRQKVEILWILKDIKGIEIGRARQKNSVTSEVFNSRWGEIAFSISLAAAAAVKEMSYNK